MARRFGQAQRTLALLLAILLLAAVSSVVSWIALRRARAALDQVIFTNMTHVRDAYRHVSAYGLTARLESNVRKLQSVWRYDWYFNSLHKIQARIVGILAARRRARTAPAALSRARA
jgi:hypothetical protein